MMRARTLGWAVMLHVCAGMTWAQQEPPAQPPASATLPDYIIGPGDVLSVFVWRHDDLSITVPVRPDGKLTTPLVEDIVASGKTAGQLARDIEAELAEYVRTPQVNVIVTTPASTMSQVKVVGQVRTPQALAYREGMTVLDVVIQAGGLTEFAAANRAKLVRTERGRTTEIRLRLGDLMHRGELSGNVPVKPGDLLVVPESIF